MSRWITKDPSKTIAVLSEIKDANRGRFGPLPNRLIDALIKEGENNVTLTDLCDSMGMIARDIKHYLEENSPLEVGMVGICFSYLGGEPELDPKDIMETKKALESMGIEVRKDGKINMRDIDRVLENIESFEKLMGEKSKNKEDMT
jgi:hypothetical protein